MESVRINLIRNFNQNFLITKKESVGQQKVTTPPPFRKLSTGNPNNLINVNSQIHAAALAAATARIKAEYSSKNSDTQHRTNNKNMQRSSSHESHLRNKIQPPHNKNAKLAVAVKDTNKSYENIYRSFDGSDLSGHSGKFSLLFPLLLISGYQHLHLYSSNS